jgi:hypothetical protein
VMPEIPGLFQMTTRFYLLGVPILGSDALRQPAGLPNEDASLDLLDANKQRDR